MKKDRVLVTGGAGYVGSVLVPLLLEKGYAVTVLDTFWFWGSEGEFARATGAEKNPRLRLVRGDIRSREDVDRALDGVGSVVHLACISNDPSAELDPVFTHSVNYGGSINVIDRAKEAGVTRFVYASSSSVYGIKNVPNVTEEFETEPLTQYSKLKVEIEHYLLYRLDGSFKGVVVRPSTVSGFSPRLRLDVVVNMLTSAALNKGKIKVFGGEQLRPLIHIKDMARLYLLMLELPIERINGKVYNAGYGNLKVREIAGLIRKVVGDVPVEVEPTNDNRSYHVCSDRIAAELGFRPEHSIEESVEDLKAAFEEGRIANSDDDGYYNIRRMKKILAQRQGQASA